MSIARTHLVNPWAPAVGGAIQKRRMIRRRRGKQREKNLIN